MTTYEMLQDLEDQELTDEDEQFVAGLLDRLNQSANAAISGEELGELERLWREYCT